MQDYIRQKVAYLYQEDLLSHKHFKSHKKRKIRVQMINFEIQQIEIFANYTEFDLYPCRLTVWNSP